MMVTYTVTLHFAGVTFGDPAMGKNEAKRMTVDLALGSVYMIPEIFFCWWPYNYLDFGRPARRGATILILFCWGLVSAFCRKWALSIVAFESVLTAVFFAQRLGFK